jgi:hypothetical protein
MTYLQRVQYGKGEERNNFTMEEPDKQCFSQVS